MAAKEKKKRESWKEYLAKVETPCGRLLRRLSFWTFTVFYVMLVLVLVAVGVKFIDYCREIFIMYEESQLSYAVEETVLMLNEADAATLQEMLSAQLPQASQFDDAQKELDAKYEQLAELELTSSEIRGYDAKKHSFRLLAGNTQVGEFTIVAGHEETKLGLLTITEWMYGGGTADFTYDSISRSYTVPEGFSVVVNGIELGKKHIDGEIQEIDSFEYFKDYADLPGMVTYTIDGLLRVPEVCIYDNLGQTVDFDEEAASVTLPERYTASQVPAEIETLMIDMAKLWADYSLADLALEDMLEVMIPGSFLYKQVLDTNYDRRFIDRHTLLGYDNEEIIEYISYGENCFACRVHMERTVRVTVTWELHTDELDNVFYMVYLDRTDDGIDNPMWYIADVMAA